MMNFSGAGVLLFEYGSNKHCINLLLFKYKNKNINLKRNSQRDIYTEPGGHFDKKKHKTIAHAAKEELFEETSALIKPRSTRSICSKFNYFDKIYRKKIYRTYIVFLNSKINKKYYTSNTSILNTNNDIFKGDISFRETDDMTKIDMKEIIKILKNTNKINNIFVKDIYGDNTLLSKRTVQILRHLIQNYKKYQLKHVNPQKKKGNYGLFHYII